jgi:hypothetical protein
MLHEAYFPIAQMSCSTYMGPIVSFVIIVILPLFWKKWKKVYGITLLSVRVFVATPSLITTVYHSCVYVYLTFFLYAARVLW